MSEEKSKENLNSEEQSENPNLNQEMKPIPETNSFDEPGNLENPPLGSIVAEANKEEIIKEGDTPESLENKAVGAADGITTPNDYPKEGSSTENIETVSEEIKVGEISQEKAQEAVLKCRKLERENKELKKKLQDSERPDGALATELKAALKESQINNRKLVKELSELKVNKDN